MVHTPDFSRVIPAFDIPYYRIDRLDGINETIGCAINQICILYISVR